MKDTIDVTFTLPRDKAHNIIVEIEDILQRYEQNNPIVGQTKLTSTCKKCGKTVDQKVVNYCKIQYQGKIYCRECQEEITT